MCPKQKLCVAFVTKLPILNHHNWTLVPSICNPRTHINSHVYNLFIFIKIKVITSILYFFSLQIKIPKHSLTIRLDLWNGKERKRKKEGFQIICLDIFTRVERKWEKYEELLIHLSHYFSILFPSMTERIGRVRKIF